MSSPTSPFDDQNKNRVETHRLPNEYGYSQRSPSQANHVELQLPKLHIPQHMSTIIPRKKKYTNDSTDPDFGSSRKLPLSNKTRHLVAKGKVAAVARQSSVSRGGRGEFQKAVYVISQVPFVIGIKYKHISSETLNSIQKKVSGLRTSGRKKKRKLYAEKGESDSDFLEDSGDEDDFAVKRLKRPTKRLQKMTSMKSDTSEDTKNTFHANSSLPTAKGCDSKAQPIINGEDILAPPSGILANLWYSQEVYSHIWVIEKILGWKQRKKVSILYKDDSAPKLTENQCKDLSDKLINYYIPKSSKRMELSRICPTRCPLVLKAFVEKQRSLYLKKDVNSDEHTDEQEQTKGNEKLLSLKRENLDDMEEVLLIKWRGKSYLHCSWERPSDLELFDTTNNTAKGKIKRFYQSQHMNYGKDWRKVLGGGNGNHMKNQLKEPYNEPCTASETSHPGIEFHDPHVEEYFPPEYMEVERIMACDENEMDMSVLSVQREINLRSEIENENEHAQNVQSYNVSEEFSFLDEEKPWDPEDNVRYIVKWKSLQLTDMTWEYWVHLKHQSVDEAEDFWNRQVPSNTSKSPQSHPPMRDYKKLTKSPIFGISTTKRQVGNNDQPVLKISDVPELPDGLKLRLYQLEGVNWLIWNWWNKRSCILADEMGLGKTIQSLCFLEQLNRLQTTQVTGPFLVVAPLSLVNQWQTECKIWAPDFNVILYHGSANARNFLRQEEFYFSEPFVTQSVAAKLKRQHVTKFNILITTYEVLMKDINVFTKIRWKALIVDEAHRLKNNESRLFSDLGTLPRDFCLLLTGTPLQNTTEELWSLLHFSEPKIFSSKDDFVSKFGQLTDSKQVIELHNVLRPYLLRRVKEDVEKSLPPKEETILEVSLTPIQKTYYKAIYEKNTSFLLKGSKPNNAPSLMNVMMELRKCCNHPFLIKGAEERIVREASVVQEKQNGEISDPTLRWQKIVSEKLVQSSGKMVVLMKLLPKLQSGGHKVLIFSQMVKMLELLEDLLRFNKFNYERLDGSTSASQRQAAVNRFNQKSYNKFVMLLSTRAGGLGLNLTSADTVIIFDSDWNPQNDLQAMARAHRIGQTRAVKVYRLLTAKTYEMHMFHSASMKLGLDRAVLAHQRQNEQNNLSNEKKTESEKESHAKEIDQLLKKGAYDVFRDDDDTEEKKFMDTDIDQLLERNSRTVTYGKSTQSLTNSLGSFSKASFVTSDADGKDIDLDDPDFWSKAIGLNVQATNNDENILINEKRNRKQVQVFDPYASFAEEENKRQEKIAQKLFLEKEEKKRLKEEQKMRREEEKEKKKKQREDMKAAKEKLKYQKETEKLEVRRQSLTSKIEKIANERTSEEDKRLRKEITNKKFRRDEQKNQRRELMQEDPINGRIKQAWDTCHREKLICLLLQFGFHRLCKIRHEASLHSIPLHDVEIFLRACVFQLGLQAYITLVCGKYKNESCVSIVDTFRKNFDSYDGKWVFDAVISAGKLCDFSKMVEQDLRMPQTLTEHRFLERLQHGVALSSLFTISFTSRLNHIFNKTLQHIISGFGKEELGKRGCFIGEVTSLDIDLKARLVTHEELSHAIGTCICEASRVFSSSKPASWWDKQCDLSLLIGTFYYGLGNYKAIFSDDKLVIQRKMCDLERGVLKNHDSLQNLRYLTDSLNRFIEELRFPHVEKDDNDIGDTECGSSTTRCEYTKRQQISLVELGCKLKDDLTSNGPNEYKATLTVSPPSIKSLNYRLQELVSGIEKTQSSNSIRINQLDHHSQAAAVMSKQLFHFMKTFGDDEIDFDDLFENHFQEKDFRIAEMQWNNLKLPVKNKGMGLPDFISWYGVVGLTNADEAIVRQLEEYEVMFSTEQNTSIDSTNRRFESLFEQETAATMKCNLDLRQCLFGSILCCGLPLSTDREHSFQLNHVIKIAKELKTYDKNHSDEFSTEDLQRYITKILLPHCLRMSLYYEGNTGDSKSQCNFYYGTKPPKCFVPDPLSKFDQNSDISFKLATTLLRRIKLGHAIQKIMTDDGFIHDELVPILRDKRLLHANNEDEIPIWWVPKVHDLALMQHASKNGLLTIVLDIMNKSECLCETVFDRSRLEEHIREFFFNEDNPVIPKFIVEKVSIEEANSFITNQIQQFPSAFAIEKRLDFIAGRVCQEIMKKKKANIENWAYFSLPFQN